MGSLILSRSFQVERYEADPDETDGAGEKPPASETLEDGGQPMDVDGEDAQLDGNEREPDDETLSDEDSEDGVNPEDIAMVPMADILNARYGCANVCSPSCLMICISKLKDS
jgi:SET domain-containing protein 6